MTTHSSVLAWGIPLTEKCGGLQSIGLQSRTRLSACVRMRTQRTETSQLWLENGCYFSAVYPLPPGLDAQPVMAKGLLLSLA